MPLMGMAGALDTFASQARLCPRCPDNKMAAWLQPWLGLGIPSTPPVHAAHRATIQACLPSRGWPPKQLKLAVTHPADTSEPTSQRWRLERGAQAVGASRPDTLPEGFQRCLLFLSLHGVPACVWLACTPRLYSAMGQAPEVRPEVHPCWSPHACSCSTISKLLLEPHHHGHLSSICLLCVCEQPLWARSALRYPTTSHDVK